MSEDWFKFYVDRTLHANQITVVVENAIAAELKRSAQLAVSAKDEARLLRMSEERRVLRRQRLAKVKRHA